MVIKYFLPLQYVTDSLHLYKVYCL